MFFVFRIVAVFSMFASGVRWVSSNTQASMRRIYKSAQRLSSRCAPVISARRLEWKLEEMNAMGQKCGSCRARVGRLMWRLPASLFDRIVRQHDFPVSEGR